MNTLRGADKQARVTSIAFGIFFGGIVWGIIALGSLTNFPKIILAPLALWFSLTAYSLAMQQKEAYRFGHVSWYMLVALLGGLILYYHAWIFPLILSLCCIAGAFIWWVQPSVKTLLGSTEVSSLETLEAKQSRGVEALERGALGSKPLFGIYRLCMGLVAVILLFLAVLPFTSKPANISTASQFVINLFAILTSLTFMTLVFQSRLMRTATCITLGAGSFYCLYVGSTSVMEVQDAVAIVLLAGISLAACLHAWFGKALATHS